MWEMINDTISFTATECEVLKWSIGGDIRELVLQQKEVF